MDDVMQRLIAKYGKLGHAYEYLGVANGHWLAVPVGWGSAPLTPCARISLLKKFANIDVQEWYPAHESTPDAAKDWTYDTQLKLAEACFKAGYPIGFGCGCNSTDANQTWGATFGAFGADLVDAKGNITIESDNVMQVHGILPKMVKFMPPDAVSWDDASNNRALISGKAALSGTRPRPGRWRNAMRRTWRRIAGPSPIRGAEGPAGAASAVFLGRVVVREEQERGKELIEYLSQREQVEALSAAVSGYDIPPFESMSDLPIWSDVEPPKGTIYNYPVRPWHDAEYYVPGSSGPPEIAVQIWNRYLCPAMVARLIRAIDQAVDRLGEGRTGRLHPLSSAVVPVRATRGPGRARCCVVFEERHALRDRCGDRSSRPYRHHHLVGWCVRHSAISCRSSIVAAGSLRCVTAIILPPP